jgi:hypothetical protein
MKIFSQKRNPTEVQKGNPPQYKSDAKLLRYPAALNLSLNEREEQGLRLSDAQTRCAQQSSSSRFEAFSVQTWKVLSPEM